MRFSTLFAAGILATAAVACGGDDDKGSTPSKVSSGAPAATVGSDLTPAQAESLCESIGKAAQSAFSSTDAKSAMCGFSAYFISALAGGEDAAQACKAAYDDCMKQPAQETSSGMCTEPSENCKATAGEIEACMNDSMAVLVQTFKSLPGCDDVGKDAEPTPTEPTQPTSCKVVEEKCPEILENVPSATSEMDIDG
jgi:hypothetical protein